MPDVRFCDAVVADLADLHLLVEQSYRGETAREGWTHEADLIEGPRTDLESLAAVMGSRLEVILLAYVADRLVGCVQLTNVSEGKAYIGMLTVSPTEQSSGFGRRILAEAEEEANSRFGAQLLEMTVVSTRSELIDYYQRRGYFPTGETRPFPVALDPPLEMTVLTKIYGAA